MSRFPLLLWMALLCVALSLRAGEPGEPGAPGAGAEVAASQSRDGVPARPRVVRDLMWVWGIAATAGQGEKATPATFVAASPAERAELLDLDNIVMAGAGLPNDDGEADLLTGKVAQSKRLVWETRPDGDGIGPPFVYQQRMAQIRKLADKYPRIEGILLDDMSTGKIDRGFKPEHIRHIRSLLTGKYASIKVWGVVYSMSLDREGINDYLRELDVINLWVWHARDVVKLAEYVDRCRAVVPDTPIVVGLYLHDYGDGRSMPPELLRKQCETSLELAHAGRIQGMVFLTEQQATAQVQWTVDWIKRVGDQELAPAPPMVPVDAK